MAVLFLKLTVGLQGYLPMRCWLQVRTGIRVDRLQIVITALAAMLLICRLDILPAFRAFDKRVHVRCTVCCSKFSKFSCRRTHRSCSDDICFCLDHHNISLHAFLVVTYDY